MSTKEKEVSAGENFFADVPSDSLCTQRARFWSCPLDFRSDIKGTVEADNLVTFFCYFVDLFLKEAILSVYKKIRLGDVAPAKFEKY